MTRTDTSMGRLTFVPATGPAPSHAVMGDGFGWSVWPSNSGYHWQAYGKHGSESGTCESESLAKHIAQTTMTRLNRTIGWAV